MQIFAFPKKLILFRRGIFLIIMASKVPPFGYQAGIFYLFLYNILSLIYSIAFCGFLLSDLIPVWARIANDVVWIFFWFMALWSLLAVCFSNIKVPSKRFHLSNSDKQRLKHATNDMERNGILLDFAVRNKLGVTLQMVTVGGSEEPIETVNFCSKCQAIQPDRAFHCEICKACILRMDHHCIMVGTCANLGNFKAFSLMLIYHFLLAVTSLLTMVPHAPSFIEEAVHNGTSNYIIWLCACTLLLMYTCITGFAGLFVFFDMCFYTSKNLTVREAREKNRPKYHKGNVCDNWAVFWDENPWLWPFPVEKKNEK